MAKITKLEPASRSELDIISLKLDGIKETVNALKIEVAEMRSEVKVLKEDFHLRKAVQKFFYAIVVAIGSAVGFFIDKIWRLL